MKVYLAGGFSAWTDEVRCLYPEPHYLDPKTWNYPHISEQEYTALDIAAIEASDVILAYMEDENPSGHGLSLEIGYAAALRKPIVFACALTDQRTRYFGMARQLSTVFSDLHSAVEYLQNTVSKELASCK